MLRQQDFMVWHGRRKCVRRVFLFEDLMVLSKTKQSLHGEELYHYKTSIKTSELGLTENVGDSGYKFEVWFRKRQSGGTYILQAPTQEIKNQWVTELSRLLWKQAIRNRGGCFCDLFIMPLGLLNEQLFSCAYVLVPKM